MITVATLINTILLITTMYKVLTIDDRILDIATILVVYKTTKNTIRGKKKTHGS